MSTRMVEVAMASVFHGPPAAGNPAMSCKGAASG